jgi:hypothetical protein
MPDEDRRTPDSQPKLTAVENTSGPRAEATSEASPSEDEFAGLEPYRPRRSPILALAVILISGYLLVHLRYDLAYALRSRRPVSVSDVRSYFRDPASIPDNAYVSVRGIPDRASAIMLDVKGKDEFVPFMRVLGTDSHLVLAQRRGLRPVGDVYDDVYTGRLMRLRDISYAPTVREHYAKKVTATRFFRVEDVREAIAHPPGEGRGARLRDAAGDEVALDPARVMGVDVRYRGEYALTLPRDRFPTEADARAALDRIGVEFLSARETKNERQITVRIEVQLRRQTFRVSWQSLAATADGLGLPAGPEATVVTVPWDNINAVSTVEPLAIPADAFVLIEGERPQDLWYVPLFSLCFGLFVIWNLLALRAARVGRAARAEQPT